MVKFAKIDEICCKAVSNIEGGMSFLVSCCDNTGFESRISGYGIGFHYSGKSNVEKCWDLMKFGANFFQFAKTGSFSLDAHTFSQ